MQKELTGLALSRTRLGISLALGLLAALGALLALDPPALSIARAAAPVSEPARGKSAPQTITATRVSGDNAPVFYGDVQPAFRDGASPAEAGQPAATEGIVIRYANLSNATGFFYALNPSANSGGNNITRMLADDITLSSVVDGLQVSSFKLSIYNSYTASISARLRLRFWYDDGASGAPGTYFLSAGSIPVGFSTGAIAFPPGTTLQTIIVPEGFTFPAGRTKFWAGVAFDNNFGATGATPAELDKLGLNIFSPATIGSSADNAFESTAAGDFFTVNNPTGSQFNFGGTPPASFGWQFDFTNSCPAVVTNTLNSGPGSLRGAIGCAMADDTVTFSLPANSVINLSSELPVTKALTIDGSTATNVSVSGNNLDRVFNASAPTTIISLTVMRGNAGVNGGGGIFSSADMTLSNVILLSNTAGFGGGGVFVTANLRVNGGLVQNNSSSAGIGGGLRAANNLMVSGTTIISNSASGGGGAYGSNTVDISGALFQANVSANGSGGGLWSNGSIALTHTRFLSNTANAGGGGYARLGANLTGGTFLGNRAVSGGGLGVGGSLTLLNTDFISNTATGSDGGGGALVTGTVKLSGGNFQLNHSGGPGGGLYTYSDLTLYDTLFLNNRAGYYGGGVAAHGAANLFGGIFGGNAAPFDAGGGIAAYATLAMTDTQFYSNLAGGIGGGAYSAGNLSVNRGLFRQNEGFAGGGWYANNGQAITNSLLINNTATSGGGLYQANGNGSIVNTLFARNQASTTGAGMYLTGGGNMQILHTTVASPTMASSPGIFIAGGTVGITNTIVASHTVGMLNVGGSASNDYNLLFGNGSPTGGAMGSGTHNTGGNPRFLNPAADNYHLSGGSAAIDAGTPVGVLTDIDGQTRPAGARPDIGYDEAMQLYLPVVVR